MLALTTWSTTSRLNPRPAGQESDLRAKMDRYLRATLDVTTILEQSASIDQLLVFGADRVDVIDRLTEAGARKALRGTNCSLLVVRADAEATAAPVVNEISAVG